MAQDQEGFLKSLLKVLETFIALNFMVFGNNHQKYDFIGIL